MTFGRSEGVSRAGRAHGIVGSSPMAEGTLIAGKYRLVSLLGRGGMGSVWRAQHLELDAPVAVKLLDPEIAANPEGLLRFHREAQAAAALRSPHVVQIFDRGLDETTRQPFIVMELMEGESLAERIRRLGLLSPEQTARIITHVARALSRAHDAGIVHRDLKPDNIFLVRNEDEEVAKVLDFGIAKSDKHRLDSGSYTRTGAVMGTPYYMSPEQISGSKGVDHRTDLWALGVIACECITGRRPFDAETIGGLAIKICAEAPPIPSKLGPVTPAFDAWFARAAAREPSQRFQSAREAAEELRKACGVEPRTGDVTGVATGQPSAAAAVATNSGLARSSVDAATAGPDKAPFPVWALVGGLAFAGAAAGGIFWFARGRSSAVVAEPSAATTTAAPATATPVAPAPSHAPDVAPAVATAVAAPTSPPSASAAATDAAPSVASPAAPPTVAKRPPPAPATKPSKPRTGSHSSTDIGSAIDQRR